MSIALHLLHRGFFDKRRCSLCMCFFFFSSRRRHTRLQGDWSSDVCSSDLEFSAVFQAMDLPLVHPGGRARTANDAHHRILAWGTFNLPRRVVVSPVSEWRDRKSVV